MSLWGKWLLVGAVLGGILLHGAEFPARLKPLPVSEFYKHFEQVQINRDMGPKFSPGVYLGTAGSGNEYNSLTLGWGASGVLWSKPAAIVYIRENRFSFKYFEKFPVFVLSWYAKKDMQAVLKIFGGKSGRDTDKEKLSGFTPVETPDGGVTYLQAQKVVICRKMLRQRVPAEFLPEKLRPGLGRDGLVHIQYTGEVLSVWRRKNTAAQVSSDVERELKAVLLRNLKGMQDKNLELALADIDEGPLKENNKQMLQKIFEMYDLSYKVLDFKVISADKDTAVIEVTQETRKINGPAFGDNVSTAPSYAEKASLRLEIRRVEDQIHQDALRKSSPCKPRLPPAQGWTKPGAKRENSPRNARFSPRDPQFFKKSTKIVMF